MCVTRGFTVEGAHRLSWVVRVGFVQGALDS